LTVKSHDRINCLYETNEDERTKIRKNLKENKLDEKTSETTKSQIHYYENCLIQNRIPFSDIRAAFDTAAETVLGCKMNLSEPPLGKIYQEIGKTSSQEQARFELYSSARVMDNNSFKKTCKKEFRNYLHEQREGQFPKINEIYFKNRASHVIRELKSNHIKDDLSLVLVDVEIYDYILAGL
jgi:hypothetical protein